MAAKKKQTTGAKAPESPTPATAKAPENPAPATQLEEASGAIVEPAVEKSVDLSHESIDANPREGTTSDQNAMDMNDAHRRKPTDKDFAGQGIDPTPYGSGAASGD